MHNFTHHGGLGLAAAPSSSGALLGSQEGGGASSRALVFTDKWAQCSALLTSQSKNKSPQRGPFLYCFGRVGSPSPRGALWLQMKVPGGAGSSPPGRQCPVCSLCGAAANTTWGEEPKTTPSQRESSRLACRAVPAYPEGTQGLTKQGHQACPWFSGTYLLRSLQV